jgi:hypothetical protein
MAEAGFGEGLTGVFVLAGVEDGPMGVFVPPGTVGTAGVLVGPGGVLVAGAQPTRIRQRIKRKTIFFI